MAATLRKPRANKGAGRPKGSNREESLARILPAARRLFSEKGYSQTTFKDVGKSVGMTHAALYSYFDSKMDLYLATIEDAQGSLRESYVATIEQGGTLRDVLRKILLISAEAAEKDPSIIGLLATIPIEIRRHPELTETLLAQQHNFQLLEDLFAEAQANGEITAEAEPAELVVTVLGAAMGVVTMQYGLQAPDISRAMDLFVDLLEARLFS